MGNKIKLIICSVNNDHQQLVYQNGKNNNWLTLMDGKQRLKDIIEAGVIKQEEISHGICPDCRPNKEELARQYASRQARIAMEV